MIVFDRVQKEFIAKLIADLGKTIFAIGLASYLFEKFPLGVKISLYIVCVGMIIGSILIHPKQK